MQRLPTYTYEEFIEHIRICDQETCRTLLELLCEENNLYTREELLNLYGNLHNSIRKFLIKKI